MANVKKINNNKMFLSLAVIGVGALALIFVFCTFSVKHWEQALVFEFGKIKRVENAWGEPVSAGLKLKKPWENVEFIERRHVEYDLAPEELLAADQERLVVDAFVRYRITDGIAYYQSMQNESGARERLQQTLPSALRNVLGRVETAEIISGRRVELMEEIRDITNKKAQADKFGLEILDVRIKRADLPRANADRVFARMSTERKQKAAQFRAEGEKRAREIRAEADKTATLTLADARKQSEILKGEGDGQSNKIYAQAYSLDPEFAAFYLSMQAYKKALGTDTSYVLSPNSDFLKYLDNKNSGIKKRR